jgi:hypothetical protein
MSDKPPRRRVRLGRDGALYAVWDEATGLWLAGLLTADNRALYLSWHPEWEVVA